MRNRPRRDQIAAILRDIQTDLDAGLNMTRPAARPTSDPPPTTAGRPSRRTPYRVNNFMYQNSKPRSIGSSSWLPSWCSTAACFRRP